ncbi:MAG: hypothetical protein IJQ92_02460 [Bacilli bacterium]|nr:hypothetical protein [Bacilli bacterium]
MKFLSQRKSAAQIIALMAMMSAINIIVSVIAAFSVIASVLLIIILPLTSTIVVLTCQEKYFPIYALATIGLSVVATIWNLDVTLFYVVPSIVSGFVFGFCIKRSLYFGWSIVISALLQMGISFAIIPLINVLFEIDFIRDLLVIFKIYDAIPGEIFICCSFYVIALIQTFLSYFVVKNEIEKLKPMKTESSGIKYFSFAGICSCIVLIPISFVSIGAAYTLELVGITIAGFTIYEFFKSQSNRRLIISAATLLINIFVVAIFYNMIPAYYGLLVFALTPLIINLLCFCYFLLKKQHDVIK